MTLTEFTNLPISRRKRYLEAADYMFKNHPSIIDPSIGIALGLMGGKKS